MQILGRAFGRAFPYTIPILAGYLFLGMAYGIFMAGQGFSVFWPLVMSVVIYAGAMQFVAVSLLLGVFDPLGAFFMAMMVNARHLFYSMGMLEQFRGTGLYKPYLIYGLTDETFSVLLAAKVPADVAAKDFYFAITFLNHMYWIAGAVLGSLLADVIAFETKGISFAMTALIVVIFVEQWKNTTNHTAAIIGVGTSVLALMLFGASNFTIPAMVLMLVALVALRLLIGEEDLV